MKKLEKGTKIKMLDNDVVALASLIGEFEPNQVGVIDSFSHNNINDITWYNVSFGDGIIETLPVSWFVVLDKNTVELDKDTAKELTDITGDNFKEGDEVELPENDGVELTIKYNGESLSINGEGVDLSKLNENEHWMIMNTVDSLYRLVGLDIKY